MPARRSDLDRHRNIEARLLEPERQPARARKQVDADESRENHAALIMIQINGLL